LSGLATLIHVGCCVVHLHSPLGSLREPEELAQRGRELSAVLGLALLLIVRLPSIWAQSSLVSGMLTGYASECWLMLLLGYNACQVKSSCSCRAIGLDGATQASACKLSTTVGYWPRQGMRASQRVCCERTGTLQFGRGSSSLWFSHQCEESATTRWLPPMLSPLGPFGPTKEPCCGIAWETVLPYCC